MKKIIVGITGASGVIYGIDLLKKLQAIPEVETYLVMSAWGKKNIELETDYSISEVEALSDHLYKNQDLGATIASGSNLFDAMIIVPTTMKTVAAISIGYTDDLVTRAADVTIKEHRQLILVPRETPLSAIHLDNLSKLAHLGVKIIPPMPAFYHRSETIQDLLDQHSMRLMDALGIHQEVGHRWEGD